MSMANGLPAHVLLVHAVVVLVPLTSLLLVLVAVWPAARRRWASLTAVLAVITLVAVPLTTEAGEWLEHRLPHSDLIETHAELGDTMLPWAVGLALVALVVAVRSRLIERARREGPGTMTAPPARGARRSCQHRGDGGDRDPRRRRGGRVRGDRLSHRGLGLDGVVDREIQPDADIGTGLTRVPRRTPTDRRRRIGRAARPENRGPPRAAASLADRAGSVFRSPQVERAMASATGIADTSHLRGSHSNIAEEPAALRAKVLVSLDDDAMASVVLLAGCSSGGPGGAGQAGGGSRRGRPEHRRREPGRRTPPTSSRRPNAFLATLDADQPRPRSSTTSPTTSRVRPGRTSRPTRSPQGCRALHLSDTSKAAARRGEDHAQRAGLRPGRGDPAGRRLAEPNSASGNSSFGSPNRLLHRRLRHPVDDATRSWSSSAATTSPATTPTRAQASITPDFTGTEPKTFTVGNTDVEPLKEKAGPCSRCWLDSLTSATRTRRPSSPGRSTTS